MKKLPYLMLAPLLISGLAGCGSKKEPAPTPKTDAEIVQEAIANPALVLTQGGAIVYSGTTTQMKTGDYLLAMKQYDYSETQKVEITWSFDKSDKWTTKEYAKDKTRVTLTPATIFETKDEYKTTITATAKLNEATASTTFYAYQNRLVVKNKTIQEYREGFADGSITANENIRFYGYVTGKMDDTYAGVYVNSGAYGIMLYAGNLEAQWNANEIAVGDLVEVIGAASPYNGLFEVKPQVVKKATIDDLPVGYVVEEPTKQSIGKREFNGTDLLLKDNSKVTMSALTYLGAGANNSKPEIADNKFNPENHAYIWFSVSLSFTPVFIQKDDSGIKAYRERTGAGTKEDPFVYSSEITSFSTISFYVDAAGGNVYRYFEDALQQVEMNKRIDFSKGYINPADSKFYKTKNGSEYKDEITPTYGGVFLDAETNDSYLALKGMNGLTFTRVNKGVFEYMSVEVPCYYNYHQGKDADGASIAEKLANWTVNQTVVAFDGYLSWYNGPNLAPIGGGSCFSELD